MIHQLFRKIDNHSKEVIHKSIGAFIIRFSAKFSALIISIIIAKKLGAEGFGSLNLSLKIISILYVIVLLGVDNLIIKEVTKGDSDSNKMYIQRILKTCLTLILSVTVFFNLIFYFSIPWITRVFNNSQIEIPLYILAPILIFQVITRIYGCSLNGLRKIWQSNLANNSLSVIIVAIELLIATILEIPINLLNICIFYAIARGLTSLVLWQIWKKIFIVDLKKVAFLRIGFFQPLPPLFFSSLSRIIISSTEIVLLGWLSTTKEVGVFSVAFQIAALISFIQLIFASSLNPKIASLISQNKKEELQQTVRSTTMVIALVGSIITILLILFGKIILNIWGEEFIESYSTLVILSLGQLFDICMGPTGALLIMSGNEKRIGYISLSTMIISVALNYLLIPIYGALGAAIASLVTIIINNVIKYISVVSKLEIHILTINKLK